MASERQHDRYKRLVGAAGIDPAQHLSPSAQVVLSGLAAVDETTFECVVEIITATRFAVVEMTADAYGAAERLEAARADTAAVWADATVVAGRRRAHQVSGDQIGNSGP